MHLKIAEKRVTPYVHTYQSTSAFPLYKAFQFFICGCCHCCEPLTASQTINKILIDNTPFSRHWRPTSWATRRPPTPMIITIINPLRSSWNFDCAEEESAILARISFFLLPPSICSIRILRYGTYCTSCGGTMVYV